jgi:D-xylose transport system substrate-binding protein
VSLTACGGAGESADSGGTASGEGGFTIGLLFSQNVQTRWEKFDKPLIEKKVGELCGDCTVEYANAAGDVATQQQLVDTLINKDIEVLVFSAVNFRSLRSSVERAHKDTVVEDGVYTTDQICTPKVESACGKAGLTH